MQNLNEKELAGNNRLRALCGKHADIEERIERELKYPAARETLLKKLKLQKLKVKEQIEAERRKKLH